MPDAITVRQQQQQRFIDQLMRKVIIAHRPDSTTYQEFILLLTTDALKILGHLHQNPDYKPIGYIGSSGTLLSKFWEEITAFGCVKSENRLLLIELIQKMLHEIEWIDYTAYMMDVAANCQKVLGAASPFAEVPPGSGD